MGIDNQYGAGVSSGERGGYTAMAKHRAPDGAKVVPVDYLRRALSRTRGPRYVKDNYTGEAYMPFLEGNEYVRRLAAQALSGHDASLDNNYPVTGAMASGLLVPVIWERRQGEAHLNTVGVDGERSVQAIVFPAGHEHSSVYVGDPGLEDQLEGDIKGALGRFNLVGSVEAGPLRDGVLQGNVHTIDLIVAGIRLHADSRYKLQSGSPSRSRGW